MVLKKAIKNKKCLKKKPKETSAVRKLPKRKVNKVPYTAAMLAAAIQSVKMGIPIRKASMRYGIPLTTLFRHSKEPDKVWKLGAKPILTADEEQKIVEWIQYKAERGFPTDKEELLDWVQAYMKSLNRENPFKDDRPGRRWFQWFNKRHPEVRERVPQHLTTVRASVTEAELRGWFADVKTYLEQKNLLNLSPSQIFNCDETNIHLCPKSGKVLTMRGSRTVYKLVNAIEKESVTTLFTYSATGTQAPPMVLYKYAEGIPQKVTDHFPTGKGWGIGNSETGWMTTETFYEYITNVFYLWLVKSAIKFPVILYLDGHTSHLTMPLAIFCKEHNIELIGLYPNSTNAIQPLDVAFFHPFKSIWKRVVKSWRKEYH